MTHSRIVYSISVLALFACSKATVSDPPAEPIPDKIHDPSPLAYLKGEWKVKSIHRGTYYFQKLGCDYPISVHEGQIFKIDSVLGDSQIYWGNRIYKMTMANTYKQIEGPSFVACRDGYEHGWLIIQDSTALRVSTTSNSTIKDEFASVNIYLVR